MRLNHLILGLALSAALSPALAAEPVSSQSEAFPFWPANAAVAAASSASFAYFPTNCAVCSSSSAPFELEEEHACTVVVSGGGKVLGEEDPPSLATNFAVRAAAGVSVEGLAGYCVRTPGEAPGAYAVNFICTKLPEGLTEPVAVISGTFTISDREGPEPGAGTVKAPASAKDSAFLKESAGASWKATAAAGSVFAGWKWAGAGAEPAAFAALSENERRNPSLSFKVAAGERVRPEDLVPTWARIDEDTIDSVMLKADGLCVETKSYVTATVSGLPSFLKFSAKSLAIAASPSVKAKDGGYTAKVTVKNASGYSYKRTYAVTVLGGAVTISAGDGATADGVPLTVWCDAAKGKVSGSGVYASGKPVSVSATAASGFVFAGWYADPGFAQPMAFGDGMDYRTASQKVTVTGPTCLYARFVEKTTKADPIVWLRYAGAARSGDPVLADADVWHAGVALPTAGCEVRFGSLSLPTVKVSGLPSGVKFDAKANRFAGVPTKAGEFDVRVEVKNASAATDVIVCRVTVVQLPDWAVGTFDGGSEAGIVSLTVSSVGKISGKWMSGADTWILSAASFDDFDEASGTYRAQVTGKVGSTTHAFAIELSEQGVRADDFLAWQNNWKVEPMKSVAAALKGLKVTDGNFALTVGSAGAVTVKATFDGGYSATCSSVLVPVGDEIGTFDVYLNFPPKKGKFDGYAGVWRVVLE